LILLAGGNSCDYALAINTPILNWGTFWHRNRLEWKDFMTTRPFGLPPTRIKLRHDEVQVWYSFLNNSARQCAAYDKVLSEKEKERASRFVREIDKTHYILRTGILKKLITRYSGLQPENLQLSYGPYGKPTLDHAINVAHLCFNMSESSGHALYAFTQNREIGVDIEQIRDIPEMEHIVRLHFSEAERAVFASLLAQEKIKSFFNVWTRKEALIKALGGGLSIPLTKLDLSFSSGKPRTFISGDEVLNHRAQWTIQDVSPSPECAAAVAVEGSGFTIKCWNWR
jgi:4'-phosphopantetheinyl transferase